MLYNYLDLDIYNIFRYLHKMHHIAQFTDLECQERQQIDFTMMHNIEELVYDAIWVKTQQIISGYKTAIIRWITLCYESIDIMILVLPRKANITNRISGRNTFIFFYISLFEAL